ncbi:protein of unknown function [Paraburkholderia kururiensis]
MLRQATPPRVERYPRRQCLWRPRRPLHLPQTEAVYRRRLIPESSLKQTKRRTLPAFCHSADAVTCSAFF